MKYIFSIFIMITGCQWTTEPDLDKVGTKETFIEFAWVPKTCSDNKTYWLQNVKITRYYRQGPPFIGVYHSDVCYK